ncbi:hypothetical protein HZ326_4592 [Fusarium oxysporum f. sp. albedinis]|nr:hypothetical protein HZ326_4592 [Fusarium oxysporum f. sp. albedinis]
METTFWLCLLPCSGEEDVDLKASHSVDGSRISNHREIQCGVAPSRGCSKGPLNYRGYPHATDLRPSTSTLLMVVTQLFLLGLVKASSHQTTTLLFRDQMPSDQQVSTVS